jgi:hypothetical protein
MRTCFPCVLAVCWLSLVAVAQDSHRKAPSVTMASPGITTITRGKSAEVELAFRVSSGFHVNSNKPRSELLIPTALKLTAPTDIVIGKVTYPEGKDITFPFAPGEPLSVYSGEFNITVKLRPLVGVMPAKYAVHGQLKYQACDNATCFPPKSLPVDFQVKVIKGATEGYRPNPAQSPHAHR